MKRINISLSEETKAKGDKLVKLGEFSTFSELVRVGLRTIFQNYEQREVLKKEARNWRRINQNIEIREFLEKE